MKASELVSLTKLVAFKKSTPKLSLMTLTVAFVGAINSAPPVASEILTEKVTGGCTRPFWGRVMGMIPEVWPLAMVTVPLAAV